MTNKSSDAESVEQTGARLVAHLRRAIKSITDIGLHSHSFASPYAMLSVAVGDTAKKLRRLKFMTAFKLKKIMRLLKLMMFASDLEKAKNFYENVLGFPFKAKTDNSLTFLCGDCDLTIFKCEFDSFIKNYSQEARSVFVFEVDSIGEEFADLKSKGVNFLHKTPAENESCFYAAFQDPFGNIHEIAQRKNFK